MKNTTNKQNANRAPTARELRAALLDAAHALDMIAGSGSTDDGANYARSEATKILQKINPILRGTQRPTLYALDDAEHATILAALRYWQAQDDQMIDDDLANIASNGGTVQPLTAGEIDALCERINFGG